MASLVSAHVSIKPAQVNLEQEKQSGGGLEATFSIVDPVPGKAELLRISTPVHIQVGGAACTRRQCG